jgi:hypothetical protein
MEGRVDMVVHGGDVFHRSRVPPSLVFQAFRPLIEIADAGVPVFVVPGNHERSRIPHDRFARHPNLRIFRRPGTSTVEIRGMRVAVSGFPYERHRIRERFPAVLGETGWHTHGADLRLLCMHHCVEGATVGPGDFTFRNAPDVIRCADLPPGFAAVLSGHIHRHQVLQTDLGGRPLPTPVLYPGSVERTAFAEMGEEKGYLLLDLEPDTRGGRLARSDFVRLPARPMLLRDLHADMGLGRGGAPGQGPGETQGRSPGGQLGQRPEAGSHPKGEGDRDPEAEGEALGPKAYPPPAWRAGDLEARLASTLSDLPRDAVLRIRVHGHVPPDSRAALGAAALRRLSPPEMNLEVLFQENREARRRSRSRSRGSRHDPSLPVVSEQGVLRLGMVEHVRGTVSRAIGDDEAPVEFPPLVIGQVHGLVEPADVPGIAVDALGVGVPGGKL